MDADHVDVLISGLTRSVSRRVSLGGLAIGGMLALNPALDERLVVAGKGKKKGRKGSRIVRKPVTRTFTNPTPITIPPGDELAAPYPSEIVVTGFANGRITDVNLTLHQLSHPAPSNVHVLLAAAHLPGVNATVLSRDGEDPAEDVTLTIDDQASLRMPDNRLTSGTFQPSRTASPIAFFPPPAPNPSLATALVVFDTADPNGTWQLFVFDNDDRVSGTGEIGGGWSLQITAEVDVKVKKKRKRR